MNNVQLLGRLTADVDLRYFQSVNGEQAKASFRIAVDRPAKPDGTHETDFINCIARGRRAEVIADYFHKGSKIAISGKIRTGSYQNKDGATVYTFDIEVSDLDFIDPKAAVQPNPTTPQYNMQQGQNYYQAQQPVPTQSAATQPSAQPSAQPAQKGRTASSRSASTRSSGRSTAQAQATQQASQPQQEPFVDYNQMPQVDEGLPFN